MACPRPVIELAKVFGELEAGEVVAVASDDPAARYDIPAWCRLRGQEYLGMEPAEDGVPRYLVRKGATDSAASPP
jgi:TusA-related sulfurtransferase